MGRPKGKRQDRQQPPLEGEGAGPLRDPDGLRPRERLFVEYYLGVANYNAAEAYRLAGFKHSRHNAARMITRDNVAAVIKRRKAEREASAIMDGEEGKRRMSLLARGDIGKVLGPDDPLSQLPDDARLTIKAVRPGRNGRHNSPFTV